MGVCGALSLVLIAVGVFASAANAGVVHVALPEVYHARLQSARSSGEHWAEELAEQPLGFEQAPQAQAEPGEMRRQQACVG
ncbi:MAG: hypothetical protein MUF54_17355 [Polyangiaceae bacterium]|nr:hypothetical protein [Polyangiaceae bacterium]